MGEGIEGVGGRSVKRSEVDGLNSNSVGLGDDLEIAEETRQKSGRRQSEAKERRTAPRALERLLVGPRMVTWSEVSL